MKRKKKKDDERKVFPIVADMLGVWEETASEDDISDYLGSYTGNPYDDIMPVQDAEKYLKKKSGRAKVKQKELL